MFANRQKFPQCDPCACPCACACAVSDARRGLCASLWNLTHRAGDWSSTGACMPGTVFVICLKEDAGQLSELGKNGNHFICFNF